MTNQYFSKIKIIEEKNLVRREPNKLRYLTILIVSEGVTEYNYFNDMRRWFRQRGLNIILEKAKGSAPINLIEFAMNYISKTEGIDFVFCVFDRDEHASFNKTINKINSYKPKLKSKSTPEIKAITSNPCFEIWPLLHFIYSSKSYAKSGKKSASDNIIKDLLAHIPDYSKGMMNLFSYLQPNLKKAIRNSEKLSDHNQRTGSINPSTNLHQLITFILENLK